MVGRLGHPGLACQFSDTPASIQGGPLLVGEHTREILADLGFDEAATWLRAFRKAGFRARRIDDPVLRRDVFVGVRPA